MDNKVRGQKYKLIVGVGALVTLVAIVCLSIYGNEGRVGEFNKANLVNSGFKSEFGDNVVYKIPEGLLLRNKRTGDEKVVEASVSYVNATEEGVYFEDVSEGNSLMKVGYDDKSKTKIVDDEVTNVTVSGDWVYYSSFTDDNKIMRVGKDGKEIEEVTDKGSINFVVEGNDVYFGDVEGGLYRKDLETLEEEKIGEGEYWRLFKEEEYIYYIKSIGQLGNLHRIDLDTGKDEVIAADDVVAYFKYGDEILYSVHIEGEDVGLFTVDLSTMKKKKISDKVGYGMYGEGDLINMISYNDGSYLSFSKKDGRLTEE